MTEAKGPPNATRRSRTDPTRRSKILSRFSPVSKAAESDHVAGVHAESNRVLRIPTKAAVVREPSGAFHLENIEIVDPREDEVLVRIAGAGICHTDLVARDQLVPTPLPAVFGHEGAGLVEWVGSRVTRVRQGDHVVLSGATAAAAPPVEPANTPTASRFSQSTSPTALGPTAAPRSVLATKWCTGTSLVNRRSHTWP